MKLFIVGVCFAYRISDYHVAILKWWGTLLILLGEPDIVFSMCSRYLLLLI